MISFIRLLFSSFSLQVISIGIAILFSVAGAHLLTPASFGELRYAMTWIPLLMILTLPGYDTVILKKSNLRKQIPLINIFLTRFILGLSASFILLFFYILSAEYMNSVQSFLILSIIILLPLYEIGTGYKNYLIGRGLKKQALSLAILVKLSTLIIFVLLTSLIFYIKLDPIYIFPAYLIAVILPTLMALFIVGLNQKRYSLNLFPYIKPALILTLSGLVSVYAFSLDKLLMRSYMGSEELARYAILTMLPIEAARFIDSIIPLFYKNLFLSKIKKVNGLYLIFLLSCLIIPIYSASFYLLSPIIFGSHYSYDLYTVFLSSLLILSLGVEFYLSHYILMKYGDRDLLIISGINAALCSLLYWATISYIGTIESIIITIFLKQILFYPVYCFYIIKRRIKA